MPFIFLVKTCLIDIICPCSIQVVGIRLWVVIGQKKRIIGLTHMDEIREETLIFKDTYE